jgi:hypothetical protein
MVVILKGYKDGKVFGVSIIVKSISVVGVSPIFYDDQKLYTQTPKPNHTSDSPPNTINNGHHGQ